MAKDRRPNKVKGLRRDISGTLQSSIKHSRRARSFLNEEQYDHMADQVRELARQDNPTHSMIIDIDAVEDFYEIRDKGGILGKMNVRVFFFPHKPSRTLVVLGCIKKENNGPTPVGDKRTMSRRKRLYLEKYHPV